MRSHDQKRYFKFYQLNALASFTTWKGSSALLDEVKSVTDLYLYSIFSQNDRVC